MSLLITPTVRGQDLGTATGFVVCSGEDIYLVTNHHVLSGRDIHTGANLHSSGGWPDKIKIQHNAQGAPGTWVVRVEDVVDDTGPRWLVHPRFGKKVDVVALKLENTTGIQIWMYRLSGGTNVAIGVTQPVSIVGFPFGMSAGEAFAIWVQGTIATEPAIDFGGLPCFLVDSRTRPGQSGSPVVWHNSGGPVTSPQGGTSISGQLQSKLLGVYSGRVNADSDLGYVWRREVVAEIILAGVRGQIDPLYEG